MSGATAWADAVRALALFANDPLGLAGVAVRAAAGPVRDHFLMLLRDSLPPGMRVHRLPAYTRDDRLLGGLDLAATLQAGRPVVQKGLLAEADGGVVVLAMAERIQSGVSARLCAALDNGTVTLQRDGLSCVLPTRFVIVALDEGAEPDERPPASLLDRIAFHIDLTEVSLRDVANGRSVPSDVGDDCSDLRAGREITESLSKTKRLRDVMVGAGRPSMAVGAELTKSVDGRHSPTMTALGDGAPTADLVLAQALSEGGTRPLDAAEAFCHAAMGLGIDSLRAPLFALRAANVAAASCGRDHVTEADVRLAARLVLAPRATRFPPPDEADEPVDAHPAAQSESVTPDQEEVPQNRSADQSLADVVLDAAKAALPPDLLARLAPMDGGRGLAHASGRAGQFKTSVKRGRPVGTRQGEPKGGARLHLLETLKAAAPWQTIRRQAAGSDRLEVRRDDFRIVRFRQRIGTTTVFAVDASGSSAMHRLGEAKGAVELLLADCYVRRDQVALLAFRGQGATLLLPPTGSLLRAKRSLAGLPGGGPTPLAAGIEAAVTLASTIRRAGRTPVITLLTDARANVARDGTSGRPRAEAEAIETGRSVRACGVATLLVDTSTRPNPFARRLADEMRAQYVALPYADASMLSRAARSACGTP
jgi:magnesium chelatase subunit D